MADQLKNIIPFVVPSMATIVHPHGLELAGKPLTPDRIEPDEPATGLILSADATNITATNPTANPISVNVLAEWWHSIERAFGDIANTHLIPRPFVAGGGDGEGPTPPPSGPPNAIAFFSALGALVGNNALYFLDPVTGNVFIGGSQGGVEVFINQTGPDNGSNAGIQQSSLVANRANVRVNQYGVNTGIPGVTGFKSRGVTIGALAAVAVNDVLWRATAIGVCGDNATIPLSGLISINVDQVGANFLGTSFEVQLVPPTGPVNGRKQAFRVDGLGILHLSERPNQMCGVAVLDGTGTAVVANTSVSATSKFQLTVQDTGPAPTGSPFQASRVVGTSFTIKSTAGAVDTGVNVYYQLFEPTIP